MRPEILQLAAKLGIPLSERSVSGSYLWDGQTLGTRYQEWDLAWDDVRDIFKTRPRFLPELLEIPEFDVLHDMAHWCIAPDWIRDLPEFGLAVVDTEFGANGGYHLGLIDEKSIDGVVEESEQTDQEIQAYLLGFYFCRLVEAPTTESNRYWISEYRSGGSRHSGLAQVSAKMKIPVSELEQLLVLYYPKEEIVAA